MRDESTSLTTLHYLVLAAIAHYSPSCADGVAAKLGLPLPLVQALVAELELAELIAVDSDRG